MLQFLLIVPLSESASMHASMGLGWPARPIRDSSGELLVREREGQQLEAELTEVEPRGPSGEGQQ